jgi:ACS family tartrate transporter-like MFS transporter
MELPTIAGLSNWQWLYLLEALPAVVLGFIVLKVLTDKPEQADWLKPEERDWLVATLAAERVTRHSQSRHTDEVWLALGDPRVLALSLIYFGTSAGLYALGLWAPLILRQFGFSPLATGWINAIPSVVAVVGMVAWARHSDRTGERKWHVVLPCVAACLGFVWAGAAHTALGVILALIVATFGISAAKAPLWAMPTMFLSGAGAAAGIAMINSIGNLGGFAGPFVIGWLKDKYGSYGWGLYWVAGTLAISAVVTLMLSRKTSPEYELKPSSP